MGKLFERIKLTAPTAPPPYRSSTPPLLGTSDDLYQFLERAKLVGQAQEH